MLYAAASHAKTSLSPDTVLESTVSEAVSGKRWPVSSELCVRDGSLRRMFQPFEVEGLPSCCKISTRSGMTRNGIAYPLPPLVRLTAGTGSGFWPTPRASEWKGVGPLGSKSHQHRLAKGYLDATVQEREGMTGKLNPEWIEWLMGFPAGWTDLSS